MKGSKGYTLLEISLIIVVVGIIIAAFIFSNSLIQEAKLKAVVTEYEHYLNKIELFKEEFHALPGDMPNAYDFWNNNCASTAVDCNGDGDGYIDWNTSDNNNESWRAWQHLRLAELDENGLIGTGSGGVSKPGENVPRSKYTLGAWEFMSYNSPAKVVKYTSLDFYNIPSATKQIFTPLEAFNLDKKFDDAQPRTGNMLLFNSAPSTNCYSGNSYLLTTNSISCAMQFIVVKGATHPDYQ